MDFFSSTVLEPEELMSCFGFCQLSVCPLVGLLLVYMIDSALEFRGWIFVKLQQCLYNL